MLNAYINHYQILSLQAKPPIRLLTSLPWVTYFDNHCRLIVDESFRLFLMANESYSAERK